MMGISIESSRIHKFSIKTQDQIHRESHEKKTMDTNQITLKKQNIIARKKEGEQLNLGEEKLIKMIEKANKILIKPPTELHISVHEKTKRINIKIINSETEEIVKEIPSEKILDMLAKMWELAGLFVDEKA